MMYKFNRTKLIQCKCNNNIIVYAHREQDTTIIEVMGIANLDKNNRVLCVCGKVHSIKKFVNNFHRNACHETHKI